MVEPNAAKSADILANAKVMIDAEDYDAAILMYRDLLETELNSSQRGEILTNLGAALCLSVHRQHDEAALARLEEARERLISALPLRPRPDFATAWAVTRANLALVYLARHQISGRSDDLLSAHLSLDGVEQALKSSEDSGLRDWVAAIRDHLVEFRDRRRTPR